MARAVSKFRHFCEEPAAALPRLRARESRPWPGESAACRGVPSGGDELFSAPHPAQSLRVHQPRDRLTGHVKPVEFSGHQRFRAQLAPSPGRSFDLLTISWSRSARPALSNSLTAQLAAMLRENSADEDNPEGSGLLSMNMVSEALAGRVPAGSNLTPSPNQVGNRTQAAVDLRLYGGNGLASQPQIVI